MAEITQPLNRLLNKNEPFRWSPECERSFEALKDITAQPLQLHRPVPGERFTLQTDASLKGLGAVLYQMIEGRRQIVSYASSSLNKAESRYHINELEVAAVIYGIRKYKAYLIDAPFTIKTDSKCLSWLRTNKENKSKLLRWALLLQEFDFTVEHIPGKENGLADFLSRNPEDEPANIHFDTERCLLPEHVPEQDDPPESPPRFGCNVLAHDTIFENIMEDQLNDAHCQTLVTWWEDVRLNGPENDAEEQKFQKHTVVDGYLYRIEHPGNKLYAPSKSLNKIITNYHDKPDSAHPGARETERLIKRKYYHPKLQAKVARHVRNCLVCSAVKSNKFQKKAPQKPQTPNFPFEVISVDILGPYVESMQGNRFVIIIEDLYTKWVGAFPTAESTSKVVIDCMEKEVFPRYGIPKTIISDNGPTFQSNLYLNMCRKHHIGLYFTPIFHQRANPVERRVQEFKKILKTLLIKQRNKRNWDSRVPSALSILRSRQNSATGLSQQWRYCVTNSPEKESGEHLYTGKNEKKQDVSEDTDELS